MSLNLESARDIVDQLFTGLDFSSYGPLTRQDAGRERLPDILFQFQMADKDGVRMLLQLYSGLGAIGGELWEQEAHTLVRLSSLQHPGLPKVLGGGHRTDADIAFVLTESARYLMDAEGAMGYMADRKRASLRQLHVLTDALAKLHSWGILHRNIWPGVLEVAKEPEGDESEIALRLTRFEMSTLISNLLRYVHQASPQRTEPIRQLYKSQGLSALICFPPERLELLFPEGNADMLEDIHSDVYGLGMIAYQWFAEPFFAEQLAEIFGTGCDRFDREALRRLHRKMRMDLERHLGIPVELRTLLMRMLDWDRKSRISASEVCDHLGQNYDAIEAAWLAEMPKEAFLVSTAPEYYQRTLRKWGFMENDPGTKEGWEELRGFIQEDLRGGRLVYSPEGFLPYQRGDINELDLLKAKYVLVGCRVAYFASRYEDNRASSPFRKDGALTVIKEALHIRYCLDLSWRDASHLRNRLHQPRLPTIEVVARGTAKLDDEQIRRDKRPTWDPLLRSVERDVIVSSWQIHFEHAIEWLLDVHEASIAVKQFAFTRVSPADSELVTLRSDIEADDTRRHNNTLYGLYERAILGGRLSFGDFFENQDDRDVWFFPDAQRSDGEDGERQGRAEFVKKLSPHEIQIKRSVDAPRVPQRGWLMPFGELAAREQLNRERLAREELLENQSLMQQLRSPRALVHASHPWEITVLGKTLGQTQDEEGGEQARRTLEVVRSMLGSWPFFAIHGPPGSGKTTVTAAAVTAALRTDRSQRILVAAQSNFSLDNMAERILKELRLVHLDVLAVRVSSSGPSEQKVKKSIEPYLIHNLAEELIQKIQRKCELRLATGEDSDALRSLITEWKDQVESCLIELRERLRRGTNLVFATCSGSSPRILDALPNEELFDWVIVEEAAKAWPTELAIPLVRGLKWTLIGDYVQLPAFQRAEIDNLLKQCRDQDRDEELRHQTSNTEEILGVFDLFRNLFKPEARKGKPDDQGPRQTSFQQGMLKRPCERLSTQFRMHHPIGELVSRCFYDGELRTASSANVHGHWLTAPGWLKDHHLVWLNTRWRVDCTEERFWFNPGEAKLIKTLVESMMPALLRSENDGERFAILTPFRAQRKCLIDTLGEAYEDYIHTVDSFQGKEADVVIVSLVRSNDRPNEKTKGRIGFLASYQRANVMLSRAKKLLVVVGNLEHFEQTKEEENAKVWGNICKHFRDLGEIVDAQRLFKA